MALVVHYESEFVELTDFEVHSPTVRLLPRAWCRRLGLVVLNRVDAADRAPAVVAMVAPEDQTTAEEVARLLGRPIHVRRLTRYEVDHALNLGWDGPESLGNEGNGRVLRSPGPLLRPESSAVDLVDRLLIDAIHSGASDIHLETYAHDVDLRLRIDGRMEQVFTHITPDNVAEVVARLKVLANLDIAERWKAQDGRFRVTLVQGAETRVVDLRINTAPSPAGQDVVLRILDATRGLLPLQALGLTPALLKEWRKLIHNPEGMLLVTGPTGSGKTTTLYASLAELVAEGRKIVTAEDPIEYVVDHVNQKQVSPQMGWAELLRAALRQNPDVLFFGELRDKDSAANATSAPSHPPGKKRSSSSNGGGGSSSSNAANSTAAATVANALKTCPACGEINPLARLSCRLCAAKFSVRQTSELLQQPSRPMIGASGEVRYGARDGP